MAAPSSYPVVRGERDKMRAGDADRERVAAFLNTAYVDGRLSKDEYDGRLESTFSARTYAELDQLVADLPAAPATGVGPAGTAAVTPAADTNRLAMASLACGLLQFMFFPLPTIAAIVLGHRARRQIQSTGERGAGLALAGLTLGWAVVILSILVAAALIVGAGMHGHMHMR